MHNYLVEVQTDHLEKITRAKPVQALAELIWNALDADADKVSVIFEENALGALDRITIKDNGNGLSYAEAPECFRRLGGSWKKTGATTSKGRFLHGQEGRGRFKAFAIGGFAEWSVIYDRDGKRWSYSISMSGANIRNIMISDEAEARQGTENGITLVISEPIKDFHSLGGESLSGFLCERSHTMIISFNRKDSYDDPRPIHPGQAT